jgi:hypothetical protein
VASCVFVSIHETGKNVELQCEIAPANDCKMTKIDKKNGSCRDSNAGPLANVA